MVFGNLFKFTSQDMAIDLGTANTVVYVRDRKSTRLNSSHDQISYAVFCLNKKNTTD